MPSSDPSPARLNRLLAFIEQDAGNLTLRKDAVREACDIGHWDTAGKLIDAGLEAHPGEAGLLALAGFAHLQAQRYDEAERVLSAALSQGLDAAELHYNLAFAQFMQKRHAEAFDRLAPSVLQALPLALLLRARCLHHLGRPAEAIVDCKAHLALAPGDADTHGLLGLLLFEQGQGEAATAHIEAALSKNPKQLEAMLALASRQADSQEYDAARDSFDTLLQAHPECGRAWLGLALIKVSHMQVEAAKRDIELAATHMPDHVGTWHVLAWVHILLGDPPAAGRAFEQAMAPDRNFGETHGGLAVVAALQGREVDARAGIKRSLRLDPQSMSAQYALMLLLQRDGQHDEAQALLDAFLARPVAHSDMQYRDLVTTHMKHVRMDAEQFAAPIVRH